MGVKRRVSKMKIGANSKVIIDRNGGTVEIWNKTNSDVSIRFYFK
jgi:hypothetical protein